MVHLLALSYLGEVGFNPRAIHVEFVLDIVALTQVFCDYVIFPIKHRLKFSSANLFDKNTL